MWCSIPLPLTADESSETFDASGKAEHFANLKAALARWEFRENYPWISVINEGTLSTDNVLSDFLWLTFTRSDPAQDIYGLDETICDKHWKCQAPLIIDARVKPQHQKQLTVSAEIKARAKHILKDIGD